MPNYFKGFSLQDRNKAKQDILNLVKKCNKNHKKCDLFEICQKLNLDMRWVSEIAKELIAEGRLKPKDGKHTK